MKDIEPDYVCPGLVNTSYCSAPVKTGEYNSDGSAVISSEYNSDGHRCKEMADIDLDNYVLFAGSSHSEGVGVEIDESFPAIVAKEFGCDYYNLSVGGGGLDAVEHNLLLWFLQHDKPPKFIFCEWPPAERFMSQLPEYENLSPAGAWTAPEFLVNAYYPLEVKSKLVYALIYEVAPCPVVDIRAGTLSVLENPYTIWHQRDDLGTDGEHPGPKSHKATAEKIIELVKSR
jgi:hypothetical protein